ncbi:MAG: efflux RND transporter periplasmic adaptor subunit [Candidatus Paracaedibacteraceae bacterium]|nr:efflux RND transporter periplasmic adaptor subunit [Candidatus Paracaedibacteraceae bacterium]
MLNKKTKIYGIFIFFLLAIGGYLKTKEKKKQIENAPLISVEKPKRQTLPRILNVPSTFEETEHISVRARVDGFIKKVYFKEGDPVKEGDPLIDIDDDLLQTQLRQAEAALQKNMAQLAQSENEFKRQSNLAKKDMASKSTFETAEATVKGLKASVLSDQAYVDSLKIQISYTHIKSPINALSGFLKVNIGNFVRQSENTPLLSLKQIDPITILFEVPERFAVELLRLPMKSIKISLTDILNSPIREKVNVVSFDNSVDKKSGTMRIKASVTNQEFKLRPGMSVVGNIQFGELKDVLTIPVDALQIGQNGSFIFIFDEKTNVVKKKPVVSKNIIGSVAIIDSGISDTDLVVTEGQIRLSDGAKAKIQNKRNDTLLKKAA